MDTANLIQGLVSLIAFIAFFFMVTNIGDIRRILKRRFPDENDSLDAYHMYMFWKKTPEAVEKLKEGFWLEMAKIKRQPLSKEQRLGKYNLLVRRFKNHFDEHGIVIPEWDGESYH